MARQIPSGTPTRAQRYIFPSRRNVVLTASVVLGIAVVVALVGGYLAGARRTLSPGHVAQSHAPIDFRCTQCHTPGGDVAELRCARCHDQTGSERLTNAAHVLFGSGDSNKSDRAPDLDCARCHADHRGRATKVATVDDRECATCHGFGSFSRHPEFAAVRAGISTGLGIRFPHDRHIVDARKATGLECRACHEPTPDRVGFQPISFDRHCASCHLVRGVLTGQTDALSADAIVLPNAVPELAALARQPQIRDAPRGRKEAVGLVHRDPWVLYNARRLRRAIDPDGEVAERVALRSRIAWLTQQLNVPPTAAIASERLDDSIRTLEGDLARLNTQLARPPQPGDDERALAQMSEAVQTVSGQLRGAATPDQATEAAALASERPDLTTQMPARDDQAARLFEQRRTELQRLLAAIGARGDDRLRVRAERLLTQVNALRFDPVASPADRSLLQQRLLALSDVLRTVASAADPQAPFGAAQVDALRRLASEQVGGGLSPELFEARRSELLGLLDAIDKRGGESARLRTAALRARILTLRPGDGGDGELRREQRRRQRLLERLRLERELLAGGERSEAPSAGESDRPAIAALLTALQRRLADLESGGRVNAATTPEERERLSLEFSGLLAACDKCHDLAGPQLAPVTIAQPVMPRSVFSHAPHITETSCDTCHRPVRQSKLATDINVPGVAGCQTCHRRGAVRATCQTCHLYHPKSLAHLVVRG
jgi:hypothetical protein